jgi:hypothetical protein
MLYPFGFLRGSGGFQGLLDLYPNAAAAYSLRKLRADYSGAAVRIRRSGDNSESDFGFDVNNDFDVAGAQAFCVAGGGSQNGFIATWYDQSGNSVNSSQTTAAQQPQIIASGLILLQSLKPCITFSGFSNSLVLSSDLYNNTTAKETFALFNTSDSSAVIIGGFNDGFFDSFGNGVYINTTIKASQLSSSVGVLLNSTIVPNGRYLIDAKMVNGANEIFVNAISKATSTANQSFQNYTNRIGGDYFNSGAWFEGNIQEIVLYAADKTTDRSGITNNINSYYAIY